MPEQRLDDVCLFRRVTSSQLFSHRNATCRAIFDHQTIIRIPSSKFEGTGWRWALGHASPPNLYHTQSEVHGCGIADFAQAGPKPTQDEPRANQGRNRVSSELRRMCLSSFQPSSSLPVGQLIAKTWMAGTF